MTWLIYDLSIMCLPCDDEYVSEFDHISWKIIKYVLAFYPEIRAIALYEWNSDLKKAKCM